METAPCYYSVFVSFIISFFFINTLVAQTTPKSIFDDWYSPTIIEAELKIDIDSIYSNRKSDEYMDATFNFIDVNGKRQTWDIKVKTRGRFRRMKCDFPPLKLNFSKKELQTAGYLPYDKYKLVTHCLENEAGDQNVIKEYLAYQMFHEITSDSYRAQLIRITYVDNNNPDNRFTNLGIILESTSELTNRLATTKPEVIYGLDADNFNQDNLTTMALFNYMIGNTDWSIEANKNVKILKDKNSEVYRLISYDFDFSGLVSAPYSSPNPDLGISSVYQRYYKGYPTSEEHLDKIIKIFLEKEEKVYQLIAQQEGLDDHNKAYVEKYINKFYKCLKKDFTPKKVKGLAYID